MVSLLRYCLIAAQFSGLTVNSYLFSQSVTATDAARLLSNEKNKGESVGRDVHFDRITPKGDLTIFETLNPPSFIILKRAGDNFARNNNFYVKAGLELLVNEPWDVPEGFICAENIEFSGSVPDTTADGAGNRFYIDDIWINVSGATGTQEMEIPASDLAVYPNPFTDQISISFSEAGNFEISIRDVTGREVKCQKVNGDARTVQPISMLELVPVVYLPDTVTGNSKPVRIIKSR